jgi:hypothetical protein
LFDGTLGSCYNRTSWLASLRRQAMTEVDVAND